MIVLDTHAWLWWVDAPRRLSRAARSAIGRADRVAISAMSIALEPVDVLSLTTEIAVDAAHLRFARDPVDRIVYATARAADAKLVTRDERMRRFDSELTVW